MSVEGTQASANTVQAPAQANSVANGAAVETPSTPDPRLIQLASREKMLRAKDREIKEREMAVKIKEQLEYIPKSELSKYVPLEELERDPLKYVDYNKLTEKQLINIQSQDPIAAELARQRQITEQLQAKIDQVEKSSQENQTQSYQQAINQITDEVKNMVETDERYEAIKETGSYQDVVKFIETYFQKTNKIIDYSEAADFIENDLIERAAKMAKFKKVQKILTPEPIKEEATQAAQVMAKAKRSNNITITNRDQSPRPQTTLTSQIQSTTKPLTPRERAILAGKGLLK